MTEAYGPERDPLERRLEQLRREFDAGFAQPWKADREESASMLCFVAETGRFAAPLAALHSLAKAGAVVPVPSRSPALLGLTVMQARLMPVYSLARLTGASSSSQVAASPPVWLAILRGPLPAALGLDALAGYAGPQSFAGLAEGSAPSFVSGSVEYRDQLYALLDCAALYENITRSPVNPRKGPDKNP